MDLRERVVAAVDAGMSQSQAAERFGVSLRTVERYLARRRATGSLAATGRPPAGQVPLHGPQRHPEPRRRLRLGHSGIDRGHHSLTQIDRVRPHPERGTR